ncbi:hypothetical protein K2X85_15730 [bacterium]|nr:hypothetical protein [bacterium]
MLPKIGNSFLTAVVDRLGSLADQYQVVVVVGGGSPVDELRQQCQAGQLANDIAHERALDIMDFHARLYAKSIAGAVLLSSWKKLDDEPASVVFLEVSADIRRDADVPVGWDVTSDSIAAFIAIKLRADRLILFKSVGTSGSFDPEVACQRGWIDRHFPKLVFPLVETGCQSEWFNARQASDRDG